MSVPYFNYSFDSELNISNIVTNHIISHDIPVTDGLYMRFEGKNYDEASKTWYDSGGSGRHITPSSITGTPYLTIQGRNTNGTFLRSFQVLKGSTTEVINIGNPRLEQYTFFHIARYANASTNRGRIFWTTGMDSVYGFYAGYTGVAHHNGWITASTGNNYGTDFFIGCDCSNSYRTNGIERATTTNTTTFFGQGLGINTISNEKSDFEIADIIIYNRYLSLDERIQMENYLGSIYGISIIQNTLPVTTNLYMRFEAKNYSPSLKTWTDTGGSNRHITSANIGGTPSLVTQTYNSNGATKISFMAVTGGTGETITLGNAQLNNYTLFFIARYGGTNKQRIFTTANGDNWLSGFWGGLTGVAHHNSWLTSYAIDNHGSNFFISTDCQNSYRSNGIERATANGTVTYLPAITINGWGGTYPEKSDFEIAEIIIYDRVLTLAERIQVENYLASIYGITISAVTTTNYVTQLAKLPSCRLGTNGVSFACWFRCQNSQTASTYPRIFDFGKTSTSQVALYIDGVIGKLGLYIPESSVNLIIQSGPYVLDNVWRHVAWTISPNGTHNVYINGTLIYTNTSYFYPQNYDFTSNLIGQSNTSGDIFFNGAINEFKFYKSTLTANEVYNLYDHNNTYPTITPTTTIPTPYLYYNFDPSGSMAGNLGTYILNKGTPNQQVIPNTTFAQNYQWTTRENCPIIWTASGSSFMPSTTAIGGRITKYEPFRIFDGSSNGGWVTSANTYFLQSGGIIGDYRGTTTTIATINSVSTTINGEWIQIQSTVPVQMKSYKFESYYDNSNSLACALPQTYYILGSNNGTTWDPIQYVVNNYASTNDASSNVNYTNTYTITNNTTTTVSGNYNSKGFVTIQGFSTSFNYYNYFRLCVNKVFGKRLGYTNIASSITNDFLAIGEWNIQFVPQYYYDAVLGSTGLIQQSDYRIPNNQVMTNAKAEQYIRLPTFSTDVSGLTFTCWFRSNNNGTWARLFEFANSLLNNGNNNLILFINNNYIGNNINQYFYNIQNNNIVPEINDNIWRHVAWTINTNGISTLYINGQSVFSQKSHYPFPISRTTNFLLKSLWNPDPSYNGAIDEFAMYKTVLSDTAINTIYNSNKSIFDIYNDGSNNQITSTYIATPDLYYTFDSDTVRYNYLANKATGIYDTVMSKDTMIDTTDYKIGNGSILFDGLPNTYVQLPKLSATGINGLTFACWFRSNGNIDNTSIFDFGNGLISDNISAKINRNNLTLSINNGPISPFIYNPYFHYKFNTSDVTNYTLKNYGGGISDISGRYDAFIGSGASTIIDYTNTETFQISPNSLDASATWVTRINNNAFSVQWDVSASSFITGYEPYKAFNTRTTTTDLGFVTGSGSDSLYQSTNTLPGLYTGNKTTIVSTIGSISGEWLQLKLSNSSLYLNHNFVTYNDGSNLAARCLPARYYIVGSNDGTTWYPIQDISYGFSATADTTTAQTTQTIDLKSNTTSTYYGTPNSVGYVSLNQYNTSNNYYTFFRVIFNEIFGKRYGYTANMPNSLNKVYMAEMNINFLSSSLLGPTINNILTTSNIQNESLVLNGLDNQRVTLPAFTSGQDGLTFTFWMRSDTNTGGKNGAKIMDFGNDSKTDNITMSVQNDSLCCDIYNNGISSSVNTVLRFKPIYYYNFDDNTVNSTTVANLASGNLTNYGNSFSNPPEANNYNTFLANLYNGATAKSKVLTLSRTSATNSSSQFMKLPMMYLDSTKGVTMGCWFRTTDTGGTYPRIFTLGADSGTVYQIGFGLTTDRRLSVFSQDTLFRFWDPCIHFNINDGVWRHFMWTIDGGTSGTAGATWKLYINGVFQFKYPNQYYPVTGVRLYNYIGRSNNSADSTFDGQISEMFMANIELKAEEIFGLYSNNSSFFYGLNDNNWRHYAWTIANNSLYNTPSNLKISNSYKSNITMSTWKLYVNGVLTTTLSNMNYPNNISRIYNYICGSNTLTDPSFNGAIDDFRMYKSVLSDDDILSIYQNPSYSNISNTTTMKNDNIVSNINDNKWRHLAWSIDTSANWKVYINGDLYSKLKGVYPNNIERYLNFFGKLSKNPDTIDSSYSKFTPNTIGANTNTWINNGVTWKSSASSIWSSVLNTFKAFNTTTTDSDDTWHIDRDRSYDGFDGLYNRTTYSTYVNSIGLIYGEWLQIQSSIPLVMNSYTLTSRNGHFVQMPRQYYIVGSNDNSNWYPIQYVTQQLDSGTPANAVTTITFAVSPQYYSSSNTSNGTISYYVYGFPTSINTYSYFRIIVTQNFASTGLNVRPSGGGGHMAIGEWNITFANKVSNNFSGAIDDFRMYKRVLTDTEVSKMANVNSLFFHYRFDQSDVNGQALANMATGTPIYDASLSTTGLINTKDFKTGNASLSLTTDLQEYPPQPLTADTTFIYVGSYGQGRYDISYSSQFGGANNQLGYKVFTKAHDSNNSNQWTSATTSYTSLSSIYSTNNALGHTGTYNTVVSGISISGEWIQLKMPNAIVLNKYMIIGMIGRSMNSFVLAGSNDGNTWTLIDEQRNLGLWSLTQPDSTIYFTPSSIPASYNYFRLIPTSIMGNNDSTVKYVTIKQIKFFANPEQYVTLPSFWSGYNGLTFSLWFKLNSVSTNTPYLTQFFVLGTSFAGIQNRNDSISLNYNTNSIRPNIFIGSSANTLPLDISMNDNVWRHVVWSIDTNGYWNIYINGRLTKRELKKYPNNMQRYTNFIGKNIELNTTYNLNGGLDDFRMYKSVLTDQEVMALYKESNKLLIHYTFDKETVNGSSVADMVGTPAQLTIANGLDFKNTIISPNNASATLNGWTTTHDNKVYNWIASASSIWNSATIFYPHLAFNTTLTDFFHTNNADGTPYSGTGSYMGNNITNVQSIGNIAGEWLQINCDVPLVMSSYYLVGRDPNPNQFLKSHYIVGSNDGINWYPLQYSTRTGSITGSGNLGEMWTYTTAVATGSRTTPIINMTPNSYDINPTNTSSTLVFKLNGYSYANNPYSMFRMIITEAGGNGSALTLIEWYIYAYEPLPSQPIYGSEVTPTTYYATSNVETGIWANDGINWSSSSSSQLILINTNNTHTYTYYTTKPFNGRNGVGTGVYNGWLGEKAKYSAGGSNNAVNSYTGNYNTYVQTVGSVSGDYLQINSNIPLQMSNYFFTSLIEAASQNLTRYLPQEYYIVGSLDGSSQWYPIQYVNCKGGSVANVASPQNTDIYYTTTKLGETQTIASQVSGTSGSTIDIYNYPVYALGYYTSFRVIVKNTFGSSYGLTDTAYNGREAGIGQWNIKFNPHIINPYKYRLGNASLNLQASYGEFLTIPTIKTLGTDGITFSLWVNSDGTQEGSQIMELGNGYNNNNITMYISNGNLYFSINNGNSSNTISNDSLITTNILDGNWRNIVVLISTDGTWSFYVNGQFIKTVAGVYPVDVPRYINYLGKSSLKTDPYFNGYIDDFRVYRTVLTTTEISEIYNSTSTSALDANGLTGFEYNGIDFSKLYKRKYTESGGIITTIAGGGTQRGDGGLATNAGFGTIYDIAIDNSNNYIYFSLVNGNYVRRIDASGIITTVVGSGVKNSSGDGGLAINASVNAPSGLALDSSMNLYIAERDGNRIRKIDTFSGKISTIAGTMQPIATSTTDTSGNTVSNWVVNDISFTASMSSIFANSTNHKAGNAFIYGSNTDNTGTSTENNAYSRITGLYLGTRNTTGLPASLGLTANTLSGDWLQIYSSQPVRMISYSLSQFNFFIGVNNVTRLPQSYYILGSNDTVNWYPIQKVDCSYISVDISSLCPTLTYNVTTNYGVQQIGPNPNPGSIGYGSYLNYSNADNSYNYFRISYQRTFGSSGGGAGTGAPTGWGNLGTFDGSFVAIGKWCINFQSDAKCTTGSYGDGMLAIGSAINSPQGIKIDSSNNIYITENGGHRIRKIDGSSGIITSILGYISPNSANATAKNWIANGTIWDASASSSNGIYVPYKLFNTIDGNATNDTYMSASTYNNNPSAVFDGSYKGTVNTRVIGFSQTISGEWIQIHSGTPCQFISHNMKTYNNTATYYNGSRLPAKYLIVGSMDASSWYPIQDVSLGWTSVIDTVSTVETTQTYVVSTNSSTIRYGTPGTIGDVYLTGYPTAANYYTYFRMIVSEIIGKRMGSSGGTTGVSDNIEISEMNINFLGGGGYGGAPAATASSTGDLSLNGTIIGGVAGNATMNYPWGLALDTSRNLYVADNLGHRIRKLLLDTYGNITSMSPITTICGNGTMSHTGDGRFAINATIAKPLNIDIDTSNNILLSFDDWQVTAGSVTRMINGNNGIIDRIAGTDSSGIFGDGGFATQALLKTPFVARFDNNRNIYISDSTNGRIRKITRQTAPPSTNLLRNGVDIANTFSPKTGITTTQLINGIYNTNLQDNIEPIEQQAIPAKGRVFTDNNSWVVPANPVYQSNVSPNSLNATSNIWDISFESFGNNASLLVYPPLNKVINNGVTTLSNQVYGNGSYNITLSEYSTSNLGPFYVDNTSTTTIFSNRWQPRPYDTTLSTGIGITIYSLNGTNTTTVSGTTYNGHWAQIEFPLRINFQNYSFITNIDGGNNRIYNFVLAGSNDKISWTLLDNNNVTDFSYQKKLFYNINSIIAYKTYRFIIISAFGTYPVLSQLQFYSYTSANVNILTNKASASNSNSNAVLPYKAFNIVTDSNESWATTLNNYDQTGNYISNTYTYIDGIGNIGGEWLQLQISLPLSMNSYELKSRTNYKETLSSKYYIVGSNDKLTWYPIQYVNRSSINHGKIGTTTTYTVDTRTNYIDNRIGDSGENVNSDIKGYSTSKDYYTYFRIITIENCSSSEKPASYVSIGEWTITGTVLTNPTGWQFSASSEDASMNANAFNAFNNSKTAFWKDICGNYNSSSGNYCDIVSPNSTAATGFSWTANGITWDASSSSFLNASYVPYLAFDGSFGSSRTFVSSTNSNNVYQRLDTLPGLYLGTTTTNIQTIGNTAGEWLQIKSSKPCQYVMHSLTSWGDGSNYVNRCLPARYYIVGSNDGSTWFPIQDISYAYSSTDETTDSQITQTISMTTNTTPTYYGLSGKIGYASIAGYSTSSNYYTYFRMIVRELFGARWGYTRTGAGVANWQTIYIAEWNLTLRQGSITSTSFTNTIGNPYSSYRFPVPYKPTTILLAFGSPVAVAATDTKMVLLSYGNNTANTSPLYSIYSNNTWTTPTLFGDGSAKLYLGATMNSDGTRIAMCGDFDSVFIYSWTSTTPILIQTIYSGYSINIRECAMSADGNRLVISANGAIRFALWNNALNKYSEFRNTLENRAKEFLGIDISKDGNKIVYQHVEASTMANQRVYWAYWNGSNYTNGTEISAPADTTRQIRRVKFNQDASVIYNSQTRSTTSNIYISYYDYITDTYSSFNTTNSIPAHIVSSEFDCWGVNLSTDGKYLYVFNHRNTLTETRTIYRLELAPTNIAEGEWIQVKLPYQLKVTNYSIMNRPTAAEKNDLYNEPRIWWLLGSNDGSSLNLVDYRNDTASIGGALRKFNVFTKDYYSYYRLVISAISTSSTVTSATVAQLFLNGIYNYTDSVITTIGTNYGNVEQILPIPGFDPTSNIFTYNGRSFSLSSSSQSTSSLIYYCPFNAFKNIISTDYVKESASYLWHTGFNGNSYNNAGTNISYNQQPYSLTTGLYQGGTAGSTTTNYWITNFYGGNESNTVAAATMTSNTYTVSRANIIGLSITADNTRVVYCVFNVANEGLYFATINSDGTWSGETSFYSQASGLNCRNLSISADGSRGVFNDITNGIYYFTWTGTTYTTPIQIESKYNKSPVSIKMTADGNRIIFLSTNATSAIYFSQWNGSIFGPLTKTLEIRILHCTGIGLSNDGNRLIYGTFDSTINNYNNVFYSVWNGTNYTMGKQTLDTSIKNWRNFEFSIDNNILYASTISNTTATLWVCKYNSILDNYEPFIAVPTLTIPANLNAWILFMSRDGNTLYCKTQDTTTLYRMSTQLYQAAGEWIQAQTSSPLKLTNYRILSRNNDSDTNNFRYDNIRIPIIFYMLGSNDGSTWYLLDAQSLNTTQTTRELGSYSTSTTYATQYYTYFRLVVNKVSGNNDVLNLTNVQLFGIYL